MIIGSPLGLTNGSIGGNESKKGMGGGIPPSPRGSMVLGDHPSLDPLVLIKSYCLILLDSLITSLPNLEGRFSSSNLVDIGNTSINGLINGSIFKLPSILTSTLSTTSSILVNLRLVILFFNPNANLGFCNLVFSYIHNVSINPHFDQSKSSQLSLFNVTA